MSYKKEVLGAVVVIALWFFALPVHGAECIAPAAIADWLGSSVNPSVIVVELNAEETAQFLANYHKGTGLTIDPADHIIAYVEKAATSMGNDAPLLVYFFKDGCLSGYGSGISLGQLNTILYSESF